MQSQPHYALFLGGSLGTALAVTVVSLGFVASGNARWKTILLGTCLAGEAIAASAFPLLSGARNKSYDRAAIQFLQSNLGMSRFYTLGPLSPNYGAFFGTASINHNYLPVPRIWIDYIRSNLDPAADDVSFTGTYPPPQPGMETRAEALRHRLVAYQAIGVKYVVSPAGQTLFAATDAQGPPPPVRAYHDDIMDIFQLPSPAPYFETRDADCTVTPLSRQQVRTVCRAPATLVRRELMFPGWQAERGGESVAIAAADQLFQSVAVPPGTSEVIFSYAPPHVGWSYLAFACGALGLLGGLMAPVIWRRR